MGSRKFNSEMQQVYEYLFKNTATGSMVSEALDIKQKNICRYKAKLEDNGVLCELYIGPCKITGFQATYLTTNPELFRTLPQQLKLLL